MTFTFSLLPLKPFAVLVHRIELMGLQAEVEPCSCGDSMLAGCIGVNNILANLVDRECA